MYRCICIRILRQLTHVNKPIPTPVPEPYPRAGVSAAKPFGLVQPPVALAVYMGFVFLFLCV